MADVHQERPPDHRLGAQLDQMGAVNEAESLQDFRRAREGHLLIRGDRPILVMSFGVKYTGPHVAKYLIEGKHHIPVTFKSIIKWHQDELVFMTREGAFGPEFQIIYLPHSAVAEDFSLFSWNPNIAELWHQLLTVLESQEMDLSLFEQGPWPTFGVTDETVQIACKKAVDEKAAVAGILHCASGSQPSIAEYQQYLGFDKEHDETFQWVVVEMMNEPLPANIFQCVSNGMVYWIHSDTQESTWEHPHLEKFKALLQRARQQRPVPHWKSIMSFQVEFLFSRLFTWECEATGEYPAVCTVENVSELARVFKVDIRAEPYLTHVLKHALTHYSSVIRAKRAVADVDDFRRLMQRYRDLVAQLEAARAAEARQVAAMTKCVECPDEAKRDAVVYCDFCCDLLCQGCFERLHARGRRQHHRRTWVELGVCSECEEALAELHCVSCQDAYCPDCFAEWHLRGGRRNHVPIVLRSFKKSSHAVPAHPEFANGKMATAAVTVGSGAAQNLAAALSPWVEFDDNSKLSLYYNVHTGERRRDLPLEPVNRPIEETLGGGLAGGWASTLVGQRQIDGGQPTKVAY